MILQRRVMEPICLGSFAPLVKAATNQGSGDIDLLNVDRTACYPPAPCIAEALFCRICLRITVAAHHLHSFARDIADHLVGEALRYRTVELVRKSRSHASYRPMNQ